MKNYKKSRNFRFLFRMRTATLLVVAGIMTISGVAPATTVDPLNQPGYRSLNAGVVATAEQGAVTINFEVLPDGSPVPGGAEIITQYASWGVRFDSIRAPGATQVTNVINYISTVSGRNCLAPGGPSPYNGGTLILEFATLVTQVGSYFVDDQFPVEVTAYDSGGNIVGTASSDGTNIGFDQWQVSHGPGIAMVKMAGGYSYPNRPDGWAIDDLTYTPETVCPPPPQPTNPDPCDGATEVPLDTNLSWNGGGETAELSLTSGTMDSTSMLIGVEKAVHTVTAHTMSGLNILYFWDHEYDTPDRLANLGYYVTSTSSISDLTRSNLQNYDVLWIDAFVHPLTYETQASEIKEWVFEDGGGFVIVQPNFTGVQVSGFPSGFEVTIHSKWYNDLTCTIVDHSHPIVQGLSDDDLSGNADTVRQQDIGTAWEIIAVEATTPSEVALLAGEYGRGRVCFSTGLYSTSASIPGSDQFVIQMVDWLGGASTYRTTYDVYFGTDPCELELIDECNDICETSCDPTPGPNVLEPCTEYYWQVIAKNDCNSTPGNIWSFVTEGVCNRDPNCSYAVPSIEEIWPPNHKWTDIEILDVNDPDGDPISIIITAITQDEPVAGRGSGHTAPDGDGIDTSTARIRAESSGLGNGRIYEISFEAFDDKGGTCSGSVNVCVPHDQGVKQQCIDDGQLYDSTAPEMLRADLNDDGIINQLDFAILVNYWLTSYQIDN